MYLCFFVVEVSNGLPTVSIRMIIGRVLGGIISNIDLDIILRWEALLSVHIKEYHFINNKHKNFRGKSFSRCK